MGMQWSTFFSFLLRGLIKLSPAKSKLYKEMSAVVEKDVVVFTGFISSSSTLFPRQEILLEILATEDYHC